MSAGPDRPQTKTTNVAHRSLPVEEWPEADRTAWEKACRPGSRLKPGGSASYLAQVSRDDFANRYGALLGFLERCGQLDRSAPAVAQVTPTNVEAYVEDLNCRVSSVTSWNAIYRLRRAAELLSPEADFGWLAEIEKDLALMMQPRSKLDRVVTSGRIIEAGLTLITEAQEFTKDELARALGVRNGLMIALLAFCPVRLKNFAALEIGQTFREIQGNWWITLPSATTKSRRADERSVPATLNRAIDAYLGESRRTLLKRSKSETNALWISSQTGRALTRKNLCTLISKVTRETLGVDLSPHLFRTAAASTAAAFASNMPHLASVVLGHTDPRVTDQHYNRASSITAAKEFGDIIEKISADVR